MVDALGADKLPKNSLPKSPDSAQSRGFLLDDSHQSGVRKAAGYEVGMLLVIDGCHPLNSLIGGELVVIFIHNLPVDLPHLYYLLAHLIYRRASCAAAAS